MKKISKITIAFLILTSLVNFNTTCMKKKRKEEKKYTNCLIVDNMNALRTMIKNFEKTPCCQSIVLTVPSFSERKSAPIDHVQEIITKLLMSGFTVITEKIPQQESNTLTEHYEHVNTQTPGDIQSIMKKARKNAKSYFPTKKIVEKIKKRPTKRIVVLEIDRALNYFENDTLDQLLMEIAPKDPKNENRRILTIATVTQVTPSLSSCIAFEKLFAKINNRRIKAILPRTFEINWVKQDVIKIVKKFITNIDEIEVKIILGRIDITSNDLFESLQCTRALARKEMWGTDTLKGQFRGLMNSCLVVGILKKAKGLVFDNIGIIITDFMTIQDLASKKIYFK